MSGTDKDNGSNDTPDNGKVEAMEVEGHKVDVTTLENGDVNISNPKDLEGEALKTWQGKAGKAKSILAKANKKGLDTNKQKTELETGWSKLEAEKLAFAKEKSEANLKPKNVPVGDIRTELGVKTFEEVTKIMDDDPEKYFKAQTSLGVKIAQGTANTAVLIGAEAKLAKQIEADGLDPEEVRAFAKNFLSGAPFTANAYKAYKAIHKPKISKSLDATLKAQETQIKFIDRRGDNDGDNPKVGKGYKRVIEAGKKSRSLSFKPTK